MPICIRYSIIKIIVKLQSSSLNCKIIRTLQMKHNPYLFNYLRKAVIYEVNLRQYTESGDIASFREHLPRLKNMGVDILWFMPIYPIGIINRKGSLGSYYSIRNFTEVNPEFGSSTDFINLVKEIHELGMKVIIDWVANHASWDNEWTINHPEYFLRTETGEFISPYDWTDVIQINHFNPAAHEEMYRAMCYWVKEFDIDGFRADLAHLTPLDFWVHARIKTEKIKQNLIWLAETEEEEFYKAFDIIYSWKWMHATENLLKNYSVNTNLLKEILIHHQIHTPAQSLQLFFTTNHDENSWNGTEFEKYGPFVKALTVFNFLYPFSLPLIYSGQEIPNLKRLLFFDKDSLQWEFDDTSESFYKTIINIRKSIITDDFFEFLDKGKTVLSFRSGIGKGSMLVIINLGNSEFVNASNDFDGEFVQLLNDSTFSMFSNEGIILKPGEYAVYMKVA